MHFWRAEAIQHTHTRYGRNTRAGVECKIELTFIKLGAAYYGICRGKMEPTYVKLGAAYYGNARQLHYWNPYFASCLINPRRACAARVTVVVLCVCVSVCLCVCLSVCVCVSTYSRVTGTKPAHER